MDINVLLNGYHWVYNYTILFLFCYPFSSVFHISWTLVTPGGALEHNLRTYVGG